MGIVISPQDQHWLRYALNLAQKAAIEQEVPVGAVVVLDNVLMGEGYNQSIKNTDPTAHAEIIALRQAALKIGNYRLLDATLYVTLEPCSMCAGALLHARIARLVYGAHDPKAGAIISRYPICDFIHHHKISCHGGVLAEQCAAVLQDFFQARRAIAK